MGEHTPTPWSYRVASDVGDGIIIGGQNSNAAMVPGYNDHPHNIANAAFIVKAVNNHDALVKALEETRAALEAMKFVVEASGKLNDRGYIPLGIQVNNALDKAGSVLALVQVNEEVQS